MKEYAITKIVAVITGILMMVAAISFGILYFIGRGLAIALNSGYHQSSSYHPEVMIIIFLLLLSILFGITPVFLKYNAWRMIYIGLCLVIGIFFTSTFIVSIGALGIQNEIFILCLGVVFILQSYLVIKKK